MKLFYCFLVSSLVGVHFCQAQIPFKIKAGGARSYLSSDAFTQRHPITTWYGGVATTLRMGKRFFFQPELLYSKRGGNLQQNNSRMILRYGYISMPLLLGWKPFKKMSLLIGAEPGYMVWKHTPNDYYFSKTYADVDRHFNIDIDLGLSYQPLPRWTAEVRSLVGTIGLYEEWGQTRMSTYKTGKYVGYHFLVQLGLCYDLKLKNNKATR